MNSYTIYTHISIMCGFTYSKHFWRFQVYNTCEQKKILRLCGSMLLAKEAQMAQYEHCSK